MSIYYFRILVVGSNLDNIHYYISRAFGEPGEDKENYISWYKEEKALESLCDLEIDCLSSISADLDEIIPTVDGIIYFINPINQEELELFEMILPDIFSKKKERDIPTIIVFYDQNGILPITVNDLLTHIWVNFPNLEAFVNLAPENFHQILQCLCLAMINGDTPLNIENAWMRFPIFIQMANVYFTNKNYFYTAQAIRKAAQIADIYNKEEFFIISEQAAYLYSKLNLYLKASEMTGNYDNIKSRDFKKKHADQILREGNLFFKKNEYEKAARQYEQAAQWSSIELLDSQFIYKAFKLAINSWISACNIENAFRILQSLPHKDVIIILQEILEKIISEVEYLISKNYLEQAIGQLSKAINRYQKEDLFDEIKELTNKLAELLIILLKQQLKERKKHAAKRSFDKLENLWMGSYNVERTNIDSSLEDLITLFLEDNNFETASVLIGKLESRNLRERLANIRDDYEDEFRASQRREVEDYINKGIQFIRDFAKAEQDLIIELNKTKISEANEFAKEGNFIKAANHLKKQADYLKTIGKDEIKDQILTNSLDMLLEGLEFENFFVFFEELSVDMKNKYLKRVFPKFDQKLKELRNIANYKRLDEIFEKTNRIYRDRMLYDQSKEITLLFIKVIKNEALKILNENEDLSVITNAEMLVKKVLNLVSSYLDKEETPKITFNKIYKKITEIYIKLDDLHLAHVYNDKIEKTAYKKELHREIQRLEAKKSEKRTKKALETRKGEELKEKDSIIEKRAQEAKLDKLRDMRERKGLRRGYFQECLINLQNQQYDEALELYKNSITRLNLTTKYKLAGVSLAIACLILMKQDKFEDANKLLHEIKKKLSGLGKLFSETFAVTLTEYILDLKKFQDEEKYKEALHLFEILPLFEEEKLLLYDFIGKKFEKEEKLELSEPEIPILTNNEGEHISEEEEIKEKLTREEFGEYTKFQVDIEQRFGKLQGKSVDYKGDMNRLYTKRRVMKKRYYAPILDLLNSMKYKDAAAKYLELAFSFSKRKDLESSSFMIMLYGLTLLKSGEALKSVENNVNHYLNSLGVNKKLLKETFHIMLIQFIIDVKLYDFDHFLPKVKKILEILPLFEEEKVLIEIQE
ncbi:MAG: hypothetical protein ACFFE5_03990 [Candidatus Thorarchaeota archaeon]